MSWIEQKIIKLEKMISYVYCKVKNLTNIHNEFDGLQGGQEEQYYHLTEEQYNCVIDYCGGNQHNTTKADIGLGNVDNTSDLDKPVSTATQNALNLKVDKVAGKQLSTEDYTTTEKNKLSGIQPGAEANVNADWNATSGDAQILNKPTTFPPSTHTHAVGDITGLQTALNNKLNTPTMTDNYYGLWDDINKKFINGQLNQDINGNIGIGATPTDSKVELSPLVNQTALKVLNYSLTGSNIKPVLDINGTWNTSGTPTLIKANVTDTASNTNSLLMDLQANGSSHFSVRKGGIVTFNGPLYIDSISNTRLSLMSFGANGNESVLSNLANNSGTSGQKVFIDAAIGLTPTSGNSTLISFLSRPTINQTGGANGITRGLYINPALTSAADWRSIEWSNNTGYGLYGTGTANNFLAGNLGIGKLLPVEKIDVNGNVKAIDFKGQSIKFNLQTSISPVPNTLVPKTDGTGLIWYNNSSVANNLLLLPNTFNYGYGSGNKTSNSVFGVEALNSNTIGSNNTAFGYRALMMNQNGSSNTAFGSETLSNSNGYYNSAFGYKSLKLNTSGAFNTGVGYSSLESNTIGSGNTGIGQETLSKNTTGSNNTAIGASASSNLETGSSNVCIGAYAGIFDTLLGNLSSFSNCIYLGEFSKASANGVTNEIAIGRESKGQGSNTATIGNENTDTLHLLNNGAGIVLKSPDGTKKVKISIDNSGNLITTLI